MTRVVADTETTGLGINTPGEARPDGVISIGLAWKDKDGALNSASFECDPGPEFYADGRADKAFEVNGYTAEQVHGLPPVTTVVDRVMAYLQRVEKETGEKVSLAAYNSPFDSWFLAQPPWLLTAECGWKWEGDLMIRAAKAAGVPAGVNGQRYTLRAAMEFAGIERFGKAHNAESDAVDALRLAEWLDARETAAAHQGIETVEDLATSIVARVEGATRPHFPREQAAGKPGTISPSDLWMSTHSYWKRYHGTPRDESPFFNEIKGPIGNLMEEVELDRFERANIRVLRGEYLGDELFSGKLDGRIEWPPNSGLWVLVEVKSCWGVDPQVKVTYPSSAWMDQIECYMRLTGINRTLLCVVPVVLNETDPWQPRRRVFAPDNARWDRIVDKALFMRDLQAPNAPEPKCDCRPRCREPTNKVR